MEITDIKCRRLSKHLFQTMRKHGGCNKALRNDKLTKKAISSIITRNKKHSSKQVVSMVHIIGNTLLQLLILKACVTFLFRQGKKVYKMLWYV